MNNEEVLQKRIEALEHGLRKCNVLFSEIRMDWTDPRHECREGWAIVAELLDPKEPSP